jgi:hypothetical protein
MLGSAFMAGFSDEFQKISAIPYKPQLPQAKAMRIAVQKLLKQKG